MSNLEIIDLYDKYDNKKIDSFCNNIDSNLRVVTNYDRVNCSFEWLDIMEDTIQYLDNILRNPNRFIVNEEDIVKIELARRVTVESIKHLSKNTNLIQDYNKETGDVRPSKILNINKEESFDIYENRFIISLLNNLNYFFTLRKQVTASGSYAKKKKVMTYTGKTKLGNEEVNISLNMETNLQEDLGGVSSSGESVEQRIAKIELVVGDFLKTPFVKELGNAAPVKSPIRKTNTILKNPNFQKALEYHHA